MDNKEIVLRVDSNAIAVLEQEIKRKRDLGVANSVGDRLLIRLLDAMRDNIKALLFKIEKNKIVIRTYSTLTNDNYRPVGNENREVGRTNP